MLIIADMLKILSAISPRRRTYIAAATSIFVLLPSSQTSARSFSVLARSLRRSFSSSVSVSTSSSSLSSLSSSSSSSSATATMFKLEESSESYRELLQRLNTVTQLERSAAVLGYDEMVFMSHADATSQERGQQKAALASVIHEKATDPKIGELLARASRDLHEHDGDDREADRVLELVRTSFVKNARVPAALVAREAALTSHAYSSWAKARAADDFASFAPDLQACFDLSVTLAEAKRDSPDVPVYTELLEQFETGMASTRIDALFDEVRAALVPLLARVNAAPGPPPCTDALQTNPATATVERQLELNKRIVTALGFDLEHGRMDVSVHPFTTSFSPRDVRITSRFRTDEWYQGLAGSVHECGHAIYEQNLGDSGLKIDTPLSMGMHESQSLFWERHIGLSQAFWKWAAPMINDTFDTTYSPTEYYEAVNALSQSFIRVESDELTYPLHVVLRYGIERDVIEGKLAVKDIPIRWNADMKSLLNLDVPNDTKGCLQDVHWSGLAFGYFPTYLIGSMTAAQLAHYCKDEFPIMDCMIEKGEFKEIQLWLTEKVHRHGSRYESLDAHLEAELGERLNPKYFIDYLTNKYTELYKC